MYWVSLSILQLDYCPGGEVFSYLRRARRFNEPTSQFYAAEILLILEYLHEREGVAYRDLKPENILIDANGHLKLVDFGFAKQVHKSGIKFVSPVILNCILRYFQGKHILFAVHLNILPQKSYEILVTDVRLTGGPLVS